MTERIVNRSATATGSELSSSGPFPAGLQVIRRVYIGIQTYLLVTELAFFFGPWGWHVPRLVSLLSFLVAIHLAILIGYTIAVNKLTDRSRKGAYYWHELPALPIVKTVIVIGLLLAIPTSLSRTGTLIPDVLGGLANLGAAYNENFDRVNSGNPFVLVEYVRIILSPLLIGQLALVIFFWRSLSPAWQFSASVLIIWTALTYVAVGTNKGVADLVLLLPIFLYLSKVSRGGPVRAIFTGRNIFVFGAFVIFLMFFGQTQELRAGGVGINAVFYTGTNLIYADPDALPLWVSDQWVIIYQSITRYLTQGYQALALSFELDRSNTFGIGNSFFLTDQADLLFGTNYFEVNNLPALLEAQSGWSRFFTWHTAYVWFASDLGYIGTIVLVGLFAYMLFTAIVRLLVDRDVLSVVFVQQLIVFFLYLPANNQVFQNGEGVIGTLAIFLLSSRLNHTALMGRPRSVRA